MKRTGKTLVRGASVVLGLTLALAFGSVSRADDSEGGQAARAVRLSNVEGQVQITQGGQMLADHAVSNTPLFEGTELTTGSDGRAEVQFEDGSVARIPPQSSLRLDVLRPEGETEVVLSSGMGYFELQDGDAMRVRFGSDVVTGGGFTVLRIKLDDGPASLAVFSGNAHLAGQDSLNLDLHEGQSIALSGDPADSNVADSIEPDSWDSWNTDRDQAMSASETASVPSGVEGAESNNPAWGDLGSSGTWYDVPDQGYVWSPYEASNADWDPYGTGYWMNTPRYGYVWVSGEPWGYLPYQCGAWNYYDSFGWGWAPGGCQTWWGGGGGWGFTVRTAPRWYRLPSRPGPPRPHVPRVERVGPVAPLIPVKRVGTGLATSLPPRDVRTPVQIGGRLVAPVRPAPVRGGGERQSGQFTHTITPPAPIGVPTRPGYQTGNQPRYEPGRQGSPENSVRDGNNQRTVRVPFSNAPAGGSNMQRPSPGPRPMPSEGAQPRSTMPQPRYSPPPPVMRSTPAPMPSRPAPAPSRPAPAPSRPAPAPSHPAPK